MRTFFPCFCSYAFCMFSGVSGRSQRRASRDQAVSDGLRSGCRMSGAHARCNAGRRTSSWPVACGKVLDKDSARHGGYARAWDGLYQLRSTRCSSATRWRRSSSRLRFHPDVEGPRAHCGLSGPAPDVSGVPCGGCHAAGRELRLPGPGSGSRAQRAPVHHGQAGRLCNAYAFDLLADAAGPAARASRELHRRCQGRHRRSAPRVQPRPADAPWFALRGHHRQAVDRGGSPGGPRRGPRSSRSDSCRCRPASPT